MEKETFNEAINKNISAIPLFMETLGEARRFMANIHKVYGDEASNINQKGDQFLGLFRDRQYGGSLDMIYDPINNVYEKINSRRGKRIIESYYSHFKNNYV